MAGVDEKILALLRSKDAEQRRKAIIAAGKSGDPAYIKPLNHLVMTETDAALRELAQKASQHIRSKGGTAAPPRPSAASSKPTAAKAVKPASAVPVVTPKRSSSPRYSAVKFVTFLLFVGVVIGGAAYFIWTMRGDQIRQQLYANDLSQRLATAAEFPSDGATAGAVLEGKYYRTRVSGVTDFFVQEPEGQTPENGWPMVMCVHGSGGTANDCFRWMGERAAREKVVFIVPTFFGDSGFAYESAARDTRTFLSRIEDYYRVNWTHTVIVGFSGGAMFASIYSADYAADFAGVVLGNLPAYKMPPFDSTVRYGVIVGDQDALLPQSRAFISEMVQRGTPVWRSEILPNVGHTVTLTHVDMTFDLVQELRRL